MSMTNIREHKQWIPIQKSPPYFLKYNEENENVNCYLTNFQNLWIALISQKKFIYDLKQTNISVDFDDENEFLNRAVDMLQHPESLSNLSILKEDKGELLQVSMTRCYECPLQIDLAFLLASDELFYTLITQPLLQTVNDLRQSESELRQLMIKKDIELKAYRDGEQPSKSQRTPLFHDAVHMGKHAVYKSNFGSSEIPHELLDAAELSQSNMSSGSKEEPRVKFANHQEASSAPTVSQPIGTTSVTKIEKQSQNTLMDEIESFLPTQIEENEIPGFLIKTDVKDVKVESHTQGKRKRRQLNY